MAYTTLVAGTTITASWANASVRDQVVSPFADTTARDAAITAPVNGMLEYLTGTNCLTSYDGSNWCSTGPMSGALLSWTPAVVQSGSVTVTVTYATYMRIGRMIQGNCYLAVTGSGTSSNNVTVSLPVTAHASITNVAIGAGYIYDTSVTTYYPGTAMGLTTTTAVIIGRSTGGAPLGGGDFTAGLASGDRVALQIQYEASADA